MRGKSLGQWFLLFVALVFITALGTVSSFVLFTLANYSDTRERLVSNIRIGDTVETNKELVRLHYFYDLSKKWKVQWLADEYLFTDAFFYGIADSYLIRDWGKIIDDKELKNRLDDSRSYIYGNAKFRQAQAQYQKGDTKNALNFVLTEVASDFEKALRNCLEASPYDNKCFDRVWNYDLATNKKDAEEALKNPQQGPKPKFVLGPIKDKNAPPMLVPGDKDKKGEGSEGIDGKGGPKSPRKRP